MKTYKCETCGLKVSATSALLHIARGHNVLSKDGYRQAISDTTRRLALINDARRNAPKDAA